MTSQRANRCARRIVLAAALAVALYTALRCYFAFR